MLVKVLLILGLIGAAPSVFAERAMGPTMCACPGRHKPLGGASSCEEACYGKSRSSSGSSSVDNPFAPLIQMGIDELFKPEDPAEVERRRALEQAQREEAARLQKIKDDRMDGEASSLLGLAEREPIMGDDELLKDAPASTPSPTPDAGPIVPLAKVTPTPKPFPKLGLSRANFARQSDKSSGKLPTSRVACAENDSGQFFCTDSACGQGDGVPSCCPKSHPYLNHCDCQCYYSNYDIKNCSSYTGCQHTWSPK